MVKSSSGVLTAQIEQGAPFHVFVSADSKYPENLFQKGLAASPPKEYAQGKLVLWTLRDDLEPTFEQCLDDRVKSIVLPSTESAPYGKAAEEAFLQSEYAELLEEKKVFALNVLQAANQIKLGAAEIGITAKSVVLVSRNKGAGKWRELPDSTYSPIRQSAVVLKTQEGVHPEAQKFFEFLFSAEAQKILTDFGYNVTQLESGTQQLHTGAVHHHRFVGSQPAVGSLAGVLPIQN